jgi:hypothetical protein
MDAFRTDNTEGFSKAELEAMNELFYHRMQIELSHLPDGAAHTPDWMIDEIKQAVMEEILNSHRAA